MAKASGTMMEKPIPNPLISLQVAPIVYAQGPKGTLEAMQQVISQGDTADHINYNEPGVRKSVLHQTVQVVHFHAIVDLPIVLGHIGIGRGPRNSSDE